MEYLDHKYLHLLIQHLHHLWPKLLLRLTATVLLPTPPLPLAIAIVFLTPGKMASLRASLCVEMFVDGFGLNR